MSHQVLLILSSTPAIAECMSKLSPCDASELSPSHSVKYAECVVVACMPSALLELVFCLEANTNISKILMNIDN